MSVLILLLRGVNVGGRNKLTNADLKEAVLASGAASCTTFLQSGNVIASFPGAPPEGFAGTVAAAILSRAGHEPSVTTLGADRLDAVLSANPYPTEPDPKAVHVYFLSENPRHPDLTALDAAAATTEAFSLDQDVLYLHAPAGVGRSKLARSVERCLDVAATARNIGVVSRLSELAREAA